MKTMKAKFLLFNALFCIFAANTVLAQASDADSSPQGSWTKKKTYTLEITESTIKYIDETSKEKGYIIFNYTLQNQRDPNSMIITGISEKTINTIHSDVWSALCEAQELPFTCDSKNLTLKLQTGDIVLNKKGLSTAAKIGIGAAAAVGAAALVGAGLYALSKDSDSSSSSNVSTSSSSSSSKRSKIKNQTEKAYEAAHRMK